MLKTAIYARYSSALQHPSSIEDQIAVCRRNAARMGCEVLDDHIYADHEVSGSEDRREGYQRLLEAARKKAVDAIIVEGQDRLWRNQAEMHAALNRLQFWGIKVLSVATGTDLTDRAGKLIATVMGWKDEAFLDDLRDKTRRGMLGQVSRRMTVGGRAYGYQSEPVYNEAHQVIGYRRVIDPEEAEVVRRIFTLYDQGMSPKKISRLLNEERVPPPRPTTGRKTRGWTWTTISGSPKKLIGILHNPAYIGKVVWNRSEKKRDPDTGKRVMRMRPQEEWVTVEAPDLRIIPDDLWESVQARRAGRRQVARGNLRGRQPKYLFSGLLVCQECGSNYIIHTGRYYACSAHVNRGPSICSNGRFARRDRLEEVLLQAIFAEVFSPDTVAYLARKVNEALERLAATPNRLSNRLQFELDQAQGELENIKTAIRRGIITDTTKTMLEEAERRVAELKGAFRVVPARSQKVTALPSTVEAYLKDLKGTLGRDTDRARGLLARLVGRIALRRMGDRLVAEMAGNLPGLINLDGCLGKDGAGRGI